MENNRYEEVEKKQNVFARGFKAFGKYISRVWKDFIASFRYNNMKLAGWLIAVPGIFIGFFLKWHAPVVKELSYTYNTYSVELDELVALDDTLLSIGSVKFKSTAKHVVKDVENMIIDIKINIL